MADAVEPPRRFYKSVRVVEGEGGFTIRLDERGLRTPARSILAAPTEALARLMAAEWEAQGERIIMASMPATRLAFTAIDRVSVARSEVCAEIGRYAGSDVLCYFAEAPKTLEERQVQAWGPLLEWADEALGLRLVRTVGIAHVSQPRETLERAAALAGELDDFALAGLAHATALFGSAVLAFALARDKLGGALALDLSRLDEIYQAEFWGVDAEAAIRIEGMTAEALMLEAWFQALAT
ncbi:MAG TPA: ATP12 family protein [Caulobacteraceae bacterium]|nr:ATP12 family protein [Caulobacteraceae bacterium]